MLIWTLDAPAEDSSTAKSRKARTHPLSQEIIVNSDSDEQDEDDHQSEDESKQSIYIY
jgi:hypothetical protein